MQSLPTQKFGEKKKKGSFQIVYFPCQGGVQNQFSDLQFKKKSTKLLGW